MLSFRTFRNVDPPTLASIWRSRAGTPGFRQSVTVNLLEQRVFAKLYFDYPGLVLAFDDERPVGFAHAAFGPTSQFDAVSTERGVTCLVVVRPDCDEAEVAAGLLARSEAYLRAHGAKELYGGAIYPLDPFYLGLYGGSQLAGVLDGDTTAQRLFRASGYEAVERVKVFALELADFRPPVSRQLLQLRRSMEVRVTVETLGRNWWEVATSGDSDLIYFDLVPRSGGPAVGRAIARDIQCAPTVQPPAAALLDIQVEADNRRQGRATFLLAEVFRHLAEQGVARVEALVRGDDPAWNALAKRLGVAEVDAGTVFRKSLDKPLDKPLDNG